MINTDEALQEQSGRIDLVLDLIVGPWYFDGEDIRFVIIDPIDQIDQLS